tara:strand:- start:1192 stop:1809 length:618 start_codon:yes stop_codon:yes gene_type:complete
MKFKFIDGGAHYGESIKNFLNSNISNKEKYKIYSFEADPRNYKVLEKKVVEYRKKLLKKIKIFNSAISNSKSDKINLFVADRPTQGSSIMKNKKTGNLKNKITINNIYFKDFVLNNINIDDFCILKLDIEGGEYEIFDCIEKYNLYPYFNILLIEFHNKKIGISEKVDKEIMSRFKKHNIFIVNEKEEKNFTTGNWFDFIKKEQC